MKKLLLLLLLLLPACKRDDMADQPRPKSLGESHFFSDTAASRTPPAHTLPITAGITSDPDNLSWQFPTTATTFPFPITRVDLVRGQQQYQIYCIACHGILGDGDGSVPQRGFTRPPSFHTDRLRAAPPSYVYDVITKGVGSMFPYADRVQPDDRWRIAAYIRALQLSQHAPASSAQKGAAP